LGIGTAVLFPLLQWGSIITAILLGAVGLLHVVPVLPGRRRLKALGSLKPIVVAATWAVGAVVLPVVESDAPITFGVGGLVVYRFLFILPNVLLADWADRTGDATMGVGTWALRWSRRSVQGGSTLILGVAFLGAVGAVGQGAPSLLLLDALGIGVMGTAVWKLRPGAKPLHLLWLDLIVAWPITVWLAVAIG
jgi:4-hydroxybenzoate polyprenyltransferase